MKILHMANHLLLIGNGIVNVMVDLACMQAQAGHEVVVATAGGGFEPLLRSYGVRHVYLPQSRNPARLPSMLVGFSQLVKEFDPDVVHAHMMTGALIARFGAPRRRYAVVTTVHNEFQKSASLMRFADRVVGVTQAVAQAMIRRGAAPQRVRAIRNGTIGTPRFANAAVPVSPRLQRPAITTVAGMYRRKGIQDLLHAFASLRTRFPGAALYLVGDGPDRAEMEALAKQLGLEGHAHFPGFVADPAAYLAESDVFVLASHAEPAGLVLCEAREAGCAIVATRVGGIPEMVDGGEAASLVPAADPQALARAIGDLLANDAARASLVARGRRNLDTFSVQGISNAYLAVYEEAIVSRGPAHVATQAVRDTSEVLR